MNILPREMAKLRAGSVATRRKTDRSEHSHKCPHCELTSKYKTSINRHVANKRCLN